MDKKIKMPNIHFHFKLSVILWVVFLVVIVVEGLVLYQVISASPDSTAGEVETEKINVTQVDLGAYEQTINWLDEQKNFVAPEYDLTSGDYGRANPFAEY